MKPIVYYVDPATPTQVDAVRQEGHRGLAAGIRSRGIPERHRRAGSADGRSGLERGRRALLGHPLAAVDDRERVGSEHSRPALGRDSRGRHPVLPQRPEPPEELVLRAGGSARSRARTASAARRSDGRADAVRRGARSGTHARLPAQHEGELDLHARADPRQATA